MNAAVRINVRVQLGQAISAFASLKSQLASLQAAQIRTGAGAMGMGQQYVRAVNAMELASKRLGQTGRILAYNVTLPLIAVFAALERQFLKVGEQTSLLRQVYEEAGEGSLYMGDATNKLHQNFALLQQGAVALSNGFGIAQDQVISLMVTFGRAGLEGSDLALATENALIMMRAFGLSTEDATSAVMQVRTSWRLTADETRVATAVIAYAAQQTRADVESLTAGFVKAAPAAVQLGMKVQDLAAILAVMQQAGFKGAESGTALNFALTRIVKATPEASKLFKQIGLDLNGAAFQSANATQRFGMVVDSLRDMSDAQRQYAVAVLFGARQQPKLTAALADMLRKGGLYNQLQKDINSSTRLQTWLENQLITAMDNDAARLQILRTNIMNNFMAIAGALTPALISLMDALRRVSERFRELDPRTQQWIVLGAVFMAVIGPIAIVISSIGLMIAQFAKLFGIVTVVVKVVAAIGAPWVVAITAIVALMWAFREQVTAALVSLYNAILPIAQAIYQALQWINPFATHSPSLVDQTRDGVREMIGYFSELSFVVKMMDAAAVAVRNFEGAMARFMNARKRAEQQSQRSDILRVGGPGAVKAFDALIRSNERLQRSLGKIAKRYAEQSKIVARLKTRLDALQATQKKLQAAADKLGDPAGLRSQSTALQEMARALAVSGNAALAGRFAKQAKALDKQATEAERVQAQLETVNRQVDELNAAYDVEVTKLQALERGYREVEQAVNDTATALSSMASEARQALADAASAASKSKGAAGGAGGADFPGFGAGAGGNFDPFGGNALPSSINSATKTMEQALADINKRIEARMRRLFPNPFDFVKEWSDKFSSAWQQVQAKFSGLSGGAGGGVSAWLADIAASPAWADIRTRAEDAFASISEGARNAWRLAEPHVKNFLEAIRGALKFVIKVGKDLGKLIGKHLLRLFKILAEFWETNGKNIGKIVGAVVGFFLDWWAILIKIWTVFAKVLWPVLKYALEGALEMIEGLVEAFLGFIGVVVSLLTGDWAAAWENAKRVFSGLGDAILGFGKFIIGALGSLIIGGIGFLMSQAVALVGVLGKFLGRLGAKIPGWIWRALVFAWERSWRFIPFIRDKFVQYSPQINAALVSFGKKIPGWLWTGLRWAWNSAVKLVQHVGSWLAGIAGGVKAKLLAFGKRVPGWLWAGVIAAWNLLNKLDDKIRETLRGVAEWAWDAFLNLGEAIVEGIWDGIQAGWGWLKDRLAGKLKDLLNFGAGVLRASSPSRETADRWGAPMVTGLAKGFDDNKRVALQAAQRLLDATLALQANGSLTLPTLTQPVVFSYLNSPLSSLPGAIIGTSAGGLTMGGTGAMAPQFVTTNNNDIDINTTPGESADPMAMAKVLGWTLRMAT